MRVDDQQIGLTEVIGSFQNPTLLLRVGRERNVMDKNVVPVKGNNNRLPPARVDPQGRGPGRDENAATECSNPTRSEGASLSLRLASTMRGA